MVSLAHGPGKRPFGKVIRPRRATLVLVADVGGDLDLPTRERPTLIEEITLEAQLMAKVEVFSAGCPACQDATETVKLVAGPSNPVVVLDMHQADVAARAKQLGITRLPSVVIDGGLASCCADRGPDEATLRAAMRG